MKIKLAVILLLGFLLSCSTSKTSVIISDSYEESSNTTMLTIIPYGNILIPGQWTKTHYVEISRQHFFKDQDSTSIAIAKAPKDKYPFYVEGITESEFKQEFYKWEQNYYEKQGYNFEVLSDEDNSILVKVTGMGVNTIFLFGAKAPYAYNLSLNTENWPDEKRIEFLENLFKNN